MNDRDNPLLEAVEALAKPNRSKVLVGADLATVSLPPLLEQLENAIRGSIVGIGGSGSLANERNVLDGDALFRFMKISTTIKEWARMAGSEVTAENMGRTLTAWYLAYTSKAVTIDQERFYTRQMEGWARAIVDKLNPRVTLLLSDRCPVCDAETWWNASDRLEYTHPLISSYPEGSEDPVNEATAMCRACATVWGARELAYALEEKAREKADTPDVVV